MIIERLLRKFLLLQSAKWHLVYKIYHKQAKYFEFRSAVKRLKAIILKEIRLLEKISNAGRKALAKVQNDELRKVLADFLRMCEKITAVLKHEYWLLYSSKPSRIRNNEQLFGEQGRLFQEMFEKELRLSSKFEKLFEQKAVMLKGVKGIGKARAEIELAKFLLRRLLAIFRQLLKAADFREAAKANREIYRILSLLQRTEVYGYLKEDIEFIKRNAKLAMKNPGENKMASIIFSAYLFTPFSNETVAAILTLKCMTRYALSKGRKIRQKLQRKKGLRVME